ncbi:hypothetical protein Tco_0142992 [Tanacetum coccineum]
MVCGARLGFLSFIAAPLPWDELVVRVGSFPRGEGYRVNGSLWEVVWVSCEGYLGGGLGRKTVGNGWYGFGGKGVRYGYGCSVLKGKIGKDAT